MTHRMNEGRPAVQLAGVGHDFPGSPITNTYFETHTPHLGIDDAWIREHTGVAARHWPRPGEHHVDMAERAAVQALKQAGVTPDEVDVIIGTSATVRPRTNPSTASNSYMDIALPLQGRLAAGNAFTFDVSGMACAGFLHASAIARSLLASGAHDTVLVVCAENPEPILNFEYRNSALFGGGAAAGVWRRAAEGDGLHEVVLHSDPEHYSAFDIDPQDKMLMKGKVVSDIAPEVLTAVTREVLAAAGADWDDVDWIIPHQGNINIIKDFGRATSAPEDKVLVNIDRRGNTSSVSVPGCLSEYVHSGRIREGDRILSVSVGRGFSWGAMLFTFGAPRTGAEGRV